MPKLSESFVASITVPDGKRDILVFDDDLPGFGIRKYATGRTVYFVKYELQGKQRKFTIAPYARGMLAEMRRRAADVLAKARLGQDVSAERQAAKLKRTATLGELIPRYLNACQPQHKPRAFKEKQRHLTRHMVRLHGLSVDEITRRLIVTEVDRIADSSGPVAADRSKASLSAFFAWAIEKDYIEVNPVSNISRRNANGARERVLTEAELIAVWNCCGDDWEYGRIVRLLMLTGQRREEIGSLEWSEVNFERRQIELPSARTKNRRPHIIPLPEQALAILAAIPRRMGRELVFGARKGPYSGWSASKAQLDAKLPDIAPWRMHDLRRTFVTMISERGFAQPHVVEALVNHISGHKAGVAGVYNRAAYANEKRQALDLWGAHIEALVAGTERKILTFQR
jgi:integrase